MAEVHYEIFRMVGRGGGWSLVEAVAQRDVALKQAKDLLEAGQAAAVKVVKETLTDSGDYLTLTIFEDGKVEAKKKKGKSVDEDGENSVPCFKPDDLYSYHARSTIARILAEWLTR